ncbi:MarR family winged helix-turn-helix transcriptional regulator [Bifidobacterium longum]|uniref:MarR family winged helix-turn-helix transcriptional regulator n=1 Tax=Bifidobacterium longum TaxID=216816 RepID=UPI001F0E8667|nr:MarR family winged helix-turn-helix transcriptional regulator [Bifidobacterium longum]MCH4845743.1 MarR family winged helix-turn-helix transcriptional regulator [Bifidobacterium longum]
MSSTSNNAAVTGNDAVDDVMATSQSVENGTSHNTADGDIKNDVLSSFISIGRIMAYRAIHRRLVSPGAKSPRGEHAFDPRRGQGRVLATLRESDQTSQKDLAAMFGMSRQAMAELLKKLEASGHISRRPSRRDSRVMMVSLTNQGRKAADLLGKAPDQTSSMLDCLNETELQTLHGYLQRIIDTSSDDLPASSDDLPASTAEDVKKCELLIEHLKRRRMPADRA